MTPEHVDEDDVGDITLIAQHIREGPALRLVSFQGGSLEYMQLRIPAISQNCHIERLVLSRGSMVPLEEMSSLLTSTQSRLKSLFMPLTDDSRVVKALANNQTLESLSLYCVGPRPSGLIIYALHTNAHLRELRLLPDHGDAPMVMPYVYGTCNVLGAHHDAVPSVPPPPSIQSGQSNTSLTRLSVGRCYSNAEVLDVLKAFALIAGWLYEEDQ
jgi:hypothetical protein